MKKILYVFAIVAFAACNNDSTSTDATKDSLNKIDSTKSAMTDSVEQKSDSTKMAIDSTMNAKKDSLKK